MQTPLHSRDVDLDYQSPQSYPELSFGAMQVALVDTDCFVVRVGCLASYDSDR